MQLFLARSALCYQGLLAVGYNHPLSKKGGICLEGLDVWGPLYVWSSLEDSLQRCVAGGGVEGRWQGRSYIEKEFWPPKEPPTLYQHVYSFLSLPLMDWLTDWLHSPIHCPCLHGLVYIICFPKKLSFPDGMCFSRHSSAGALLDKLWHVSFHQPSYTLGTHKNVILNCLEIGVGISYPWTLKTDCVGLSWPSVQHDQLFRSAKPASLCAHVAWFLLKKPQW